MHGVLELFRRQRPAVAGGGVFADMRVRQHSWNGGGHGREREAKAQRHLGRRVRRVGSEEKLENIVCLAPALELLAGPAATVIGVGKRTIAVIFASKETET